MDVVAESIELVRGYTEHGAQMKWDYDWKIRIATHAVFAPARIASGLRRIGLLRNRSKSAAEFQEIKSDLVLSTARVFTTTMPTRSIPLRNARLCATWLPRRKRANASWRSARAAAT